MTRGGSAMSPNLTADALWRAPSGEKRIPRISQGPISAVRQGPNFYYATRVMKHPDPIGVGLATEAFVEAAGPECIVPGHHRPIRVLGMQVWPLDIPKFNYKVLEPLGRELKTLSKLLDRAFDLMQAPFGER
eukprot:c18104_g1_i1 orf=487-882(-)